MAPTRGRPMLRGGDSPMDESRQLRELLRDALEGKQSRRPILQRAAALGLSAPFFGALLAACGGSDDGGSSTGDSGGGDSQPTTTSGDSGSGSEATATADTGPSDEYDIDTGDIPSEVVIMQGVDANTLD